LSPLIGSAGRVLRANGQDALPEGRRILTMRWSDPPLIGRFQPKLRVVGGSGSGVEISRTLPAVWVVPPWWVVVALVLALMLPVARWMRRRRSQAGRALRAAAARTRVEGERETAAKAREAQTRPGPDRR
ncbi:MAG: hypothetical protein JWN41_715, partial [Thermoleophilia bacterium]|nr:hypothetical protein [Thermoleophilia bacterium]